MLGTIRRNYDEHQIVKQQPLVGLLLMKRYPWKIALGCGVVCLVAAAVLAIWLSGGSGGAAPLTLTIKPLSSALVPQGQLIEVQEMSSSGQVDSMYLVNPTAATCVQVGYNTTPGSGKANPYAEISVFDRFGCSAIDGTSFEVNSYDGSANNYSVALSRLDDRAGKVARVVGKAKIEGIDTVIVESTEAASDEGETIPSIQIKVKEYVDTKTGLVVREERSHGRETAVTTRRLVSATAERLGNLSRTSAAGLATQLRQQKMRGIADAGFAILAVPKGALGLTVGRVTSQGAPDFVMIEYYKGKTSQDLAVQIRVWNLDVHAGQFKDRLMSLAEAKERNIEGGGTQVTFRYQSAAIDIWTVGAKVSLSAKEIAKMLVPIKDSGILEQAPAS